MNIVFIQRCVLSFLAAFALSFPVEANEKKDLKARKQQLESISKQMSQGVPIELKALEIRAKIHEPKVIYILDRPKLDVEFKEEAIQFTPRTRDPVVRNRF